MEPVFNFVEMFERSIGLKEPWKVTRAEFNDKDKSVHVYIEAKKTSKYPCPECHKLCRRYDNEDEERIWRHADVVLYPCYIHCRRPRVECEEHGIRVTDAPWSRKGSRNTLLFEGYAMMLAQMSTFEEARKALKISRTAIMHIVSYWVDKAVRETDLSEVERLSIDETSFRKGQSYVTVIGDPERRCIIGVENGRNADAVVRFSYEFESKGGESCRISHISMDMSKPYKAGCAECFPYAKTVYDKFHVKKLMLDGMDEVRKEEQGKKSRNWKWMGRKLLMIPQSRMTKDQEQAKDNICRSYPKTGRAYRMVQMFDEVYRNINTQKAEEEFDKLTSWMMHSRLEPMKKVARSFRKNKEEILEYFENRYTNAFAEGMNSMIQTAKRKARGFRLYESFRTAIFLCVGKLQLSYPNPFPL